MPKVDEAAKVAMDQIAEMGGVVGSLAWRFDGAQIITEAYAQQRRENVIVQMVAFHAAWEELRAAALDVDEQADELDETAIPGLERLRAALDNLPKDPEGRQ